MKKILIHENQSEIQQLENRASSSVTITQALCDAYEKLGLDPVPSVDHLSNLLVDSKSQLKRLLVEKSGILQTMAGVKVDYDKLAELVSLPEDAMKQFTAQLKGWGESSLVRADLIKIQKGIVTPNEVVLDALKERWRFYIDSEEKRATYSELERYANMINEMSERFGKGYFVGVKLPLLEGTIHRSQQASGSGDGSSITNFNGRFKPDWQVVAKAAKQQSSRKA